MKEVGLQGGRRGRVRTGHGKPEKAWNLRVV